jgi:hypothetical protein
VILIWKMVSEGGVKCLAPMSSYMSWFIRAGGSARVSIRDADGAMVRLIDRAQLCEEGTNSVMSTAVNYNVLCQE